MENNRNDVDPYWELKIGLTLMGAMAGFCLLVAVIYWLADVVTNLVQTLQSL